MTEKSPKVWNELGAKGLLLAIDRLEGYNTKEIILRHATR